MSEKKEMIQVLNPLPYYEPHPKLRKFLDGFIDKVFTYYNGRINTINTNIILEKEWSPVYLHEFIPFGGFKLGYYLNNVLTIYVPAIILISSRSTINIDKNDKEETNTTFMVEILSHITGTIIHELYHADQAKISYNGQVLSRETQEVQVYQNTLVYIINHLDDIYNKFGFCFSIDAIADQEYQLNYNMQYADQNNMYYYRRVNNEQLILSYFINMSSAFFDDENYNNELSINLVKDIKSIPNCTLEIDYYGLVERDYANFIDFKINGVYMDYNEFIQQVNRLNSNLVYSTDCIIGKNKMFIMFEYGNKVMITKNKLLNKKEKASFDDMTNI